MILTHAARLVGDAIVALIYPQPCAICDRSVEARRFGVACEACWQATRIFDGSETMCWKCSLPFPVELSPEFRELISCGRCDSQSFTIARATGLYEGALRESVLWLKREPHLPSHLEVLLLAAALREPLNSSTRIIPVPLHEKRRRARGFNQASVLAQSLAKRLRLPVDESNLVRVRESEKYRAGLDRKGRRDTVAKSFEVRHPRLVQDENILLVDDVLTTGATVSACAETLISAGAKSVCVLTIARASL